MISLLIIETLRWIRNSYALIVFLGTTILGYVSVLSSFYLKDIIKYSSSNDISVTVPDPTSLAVFESYLKNFSQVGVLLVIFIFAKGIGAGADKSTRVYYAVRSRWAYRIYLPKIINSLFWSLLSVVISYILIRYSIWTLFPDDGFDIKISNLFSLLSGVLFCLTLSAFVGVWCNSLLLSVAIPALSIYISSFLDSFATESTDWLSSFLIPGSLLSSNSNTSDFYLHMWIAILISVIFVLLSCFFPLRKNNTRKSI